MLGQHGEVSLANEIRRQVLVRQALGQAVDHRAFQAVMVQDGRIEEGRQQRVAINGRLRLLTHRAPDRINWPDICRLQGSDLGHDVHPNPCEAGRIYIAPGRMAQYPRNLTFRTQFF